MEYRVRVKSGEGKEGVVLARDGRLIVSVRAPREEGRANARTRELLAEYLSVALEDVVIVRGHQQSSKVVRVTSAHS